MVTLTQSLTLPINPPSTHPTLSLAQVWEVMHLKCRKPELFVAPIASSDVLEEKPTFIKRSVVFKAGMGPPGGKATEDLQIRAPWKAAGGKEDADTRAIEPQVDFYNLDTGAFINNTISQGNDERELYLTFYFEWPYPHIEEGSQEAKETSEQLWGMAKATVQHTIDVARDMAREGKLGKGMEH